MALARRAAGSLAALLSMLASPGIGAEQAAPCPDLLGPRPAPPPELGQLVDRLRRAVAERDADFVEQTMASGIRLDLGDSLTVADLRLGDRHSPVWRRLEKALAIGCAPLPMGAATGWECPGVTSTPAPSGADGEPQERVFVLGQNVEVRAAPSADAQVLTRLSCRIVALDTAVPAPPEDGEAGRGWTPILLPGGGRGFVASRLAYQPIGYRAYFERRGEGWSMTMFLAGD